jgi:hypothetical protein
MRLRLRKTNGITRVIANFNFTFDSDLKARSSNLFSRRLHKKICYTSFSFDSLLFFVVKLPLWIGNCLFSWSKCRREYKVSNELLFYVRELSFPLKISVESNMLKMQFLNRHWLQTKLTLSSEVTFKFIEVHDC